MTVKVAFLDDAEALCSALAYLVVELGRAEDAGKTFSAGMKKLLEKRSAPGRNE